VNINITFVGGSIFAKVFSLLIVATVVTEYLMNLNEEKFERSVIAN
jgi:hypothetical protein